MTVHTRLGLLSIFVAFDSGFLDIEIQQILRGQLGQVSCAEELAPGHKGALDFTRRRG